MENKSSILLVDDNIKNLYALENLLARDDRSFIQATSGDEALGIALKKELDLIILDVQMPGMDGFEVIEILKSNSKTREIPIIFATAILKEQKYLLKGIEGGAVDYLFKPLDPEVTRAKVDVLLKIRKQQKELAQKNEELEKYSLLINNSADLICTLTPSNLIFKEVNQAFFHLLGYDPESLTGKSIADYTDESGKQSLESLKLDEKKLSFEIRLICKNNEWRCFQWRVIVKDKILYCNARDVTEINVNENRIKDLNKSLENNIKQLEISNKDLESFSYSVSHDLRAPLRAIIGYSRIIEDEFKSEMPEESLQFLDKIFANAAKMGRLIDDLLEFSRLGRKELRKTKIDIEKMVAEAIKECNGNSKANTKIIVKDLKPIHADPVLLHQVFINLISNAIKYSQKKEKPEIEVGCFDEDDNRVYYVKDNGAGFNMKYSEKLFQVFQRLHTPMEFEGTGVGLAIVNRIITKHGGRVWGEGKTNKGAVFYFSLPVNNN